MNLYCAGNKTVNHRRDYGDNYYRAFVGHPKMGDAAKGLIRTWIKKREYGKVYLFFLDKCGFDEDYSGFLMREAMAGQL